MKGMIVKMKKLPYGISNYEELVEDNYYYVDKTPYIEKLESLDQLHFQFDKPIAFKGSLIIYPIIVSDYNEFVVSSSCFSLNKNECIEGLKTTNLGYLIYKMSNVDGDELHNKDVSMWSQYFIKSSP